MRQSVRSNISATTTSSSGSRRCVRVVLLNKEEFNTFIEGKAKAQDVFNQVCEHLGLRETEYFGLAQQHDSEYHFVDPNTKLHRLTQRGWKSKHGEEGPILTFSFRVQFYVEHISLLKERLTRHLYYQQLRDNLLNYRQYLTEEQCFLLASYALQADHGNYSHEIHRERYFDPREYFPAWVVSRHGEDYIIQNMPRMHQDLNQLTKLDAEKHFIKDICVPPVAHNLHFYKLKKRKTDELGTAWLAICPAGIEIYEEQDGFKNLVSTFIWKSIGKLEFAKKKFEIRAEGTPETRKFTYYTGSDDRSKYLLALSRGTHLFQISNLPKLAEIRHLQAEDRRYRESYIYSEDRELSWEQGESASSASGGRRSRRSTPSRVPPTGVYEKQRISMISSSSSNTTSGIVSDKMHASLDESEDTQEIMIDTPPLPGSTFGSTLNLVNSPSTWNSPCSISALSPIRPRSPGILPSHSPLTLQTTTPSPLASSQSPSPNSNPPQPPSPLAYPQQTPSPAHPISRTSSGHSSHSQRSQKLTLAGLDVSTPQSQYGVLPQESLPVILPADISLQRLQLAPTMTVNSTPITSTAGMASPLPPPPEYANPDPQLDPVTEPQAITSRHTMMQPAAHAMGSASDILSPPAPEPSPPSPVSDELLHQILQSSDVLKQAWSQHMADQHRLAVKAAHTKEREEQLQFELQRLKDSQEAERQQQQYMAQQQAAQQAAQQQAAQQAAQQQAAQQQAAQQQAAQQQAAQQAAQQQAAQQQAAQQAAQQQAAQHGGHHPPPDYSHLMSQQHSPAQMAVQSSLGSGQQYSQPQPQYGAGQQYTGQAMAHYTPSAMHGAYNTPPQYVSVSQDYRPEPQRLLDAQLEYLTRQQEQQRKEQWEMEEQVLKQQLQEMEIKRQQEYEQQMINQQLKEMELKRQKEMEQQILKKQLQEMEIQRQQQLHRKELERQAYQQQQQQQAALQQQALQEQLLQQQLLQQQRLQQQQQELKQRQLQQQQQAQQHEAQQQQQLPPNYQQQSLPQQISYSYSTAFTTSSQTPVNQQANAAPTLPSYSSAPSYAQSQNNKLYAAQYNQPSLSVGNGHLPSSHGNGQQVAANHQKGLQLPSFEMATAGQMGGSAPSTPTYQAAPPIYTVQVEQNSIANSELSVLPPVSQSVTNAMNSVQHNNPVPSVNATSPAASRKDTQQVSEGATGTSKELPSTPVNRSALQHVPRDVTVTRAESAKEPREMRAYKFAAKDNICPIHRVQSNIEEQIKSKNLSLPLLRALVNDSTLQETQCTCEPIDDERRRSYAQPTSSRLYDPGNLVRPQSWHHENFNLDQELQDFEELQAADQVRANGIAGHLEEVVASRPRSSTWGFNADNADQAWHANGAVGMIPARLTSGGHSPNNSDTVPQKAGYVH